MRATATSSWSCSSPTWRSGRTRCTGRSISPAAASSPDPPPPGSAANRSTPTMRRDGASSPSVARSPSSSCSRWPCGPSSPSGGSGPRRTPSGPRRPCSSCRRPSWRWARCCSPPRSRSCGPSAAASVRGRARRLLPPLLLSVGGIAVLVVGTHHFANGWPGTGGHAWGRQGIVPGGVAAYAWASTLFVTSYWAHPVRPGRLPGRRGRLDGRVARSPSSPPSSAWPRSSVDSTSPRACSATRSD